MLLIISPAKKLDFQEDSLEIEGTIPELLSSAEILAKIMRGKTLSEIKQLMRLSDNLAELNYARYQHWTADTGLGQAKQALLAFRGDAYRSMAAHVFEEGDFEFAQKQLRILSGLYGLLRPLDMIQAHRLEMGTKLANQAGKDLYAFWQNKVTPIVARDAMVAGDALVNLASNEYFKAVNEHTLGVPVITPVFKDYKNGVYKVISLYAKRARGMMCRFSICNRLDKPEQLAGDSSHTRYVFLRKK